MDVAVGVGDLPHEFDQPDTFLFSPPVFDLASEAMKIDWLVEINQRRSQTKSYWNIKKNTKIKQTENVNKGTKEINEKGAKSQYKQNVTHK